MDALKKLSKTALVVSAALSLAASALAQTSIQVTPNSNSGTAVQLPSNFAVSGGTGPGYSWTILSSSPGSVASPWFSITPPGSTTGFSVSVTGDGCGSTQTTCTGSIQFVDSGNPSDTITVNVTNQQTGNTGTGSTGGQFYASSGSVTISPPNDYSTVTLTNSSASAVSYNISASPANSWLGADPESSSCSPTGATYCLASGGSIALTITDSGVSGGSGSVEIAPVSVSLSPIFISVTVGSGATTQGSLYASPSSISISYPGTYYQSVSVTSSSSETFSATPSTTDGLPWLTISGSTSTVSGLSSSSTSSAQLFVVLNTNYIGTLATGTYSGSITLLNTTTGAQANDTTVIPVTLSINGGTGTGTGGLIAPASLTFNCESTTCGQPPMVQAALVNDSGPTVTNVDYSGFPSAVGAACGMSAGSSGSTLTVDVSCNGAIPVGSYTGTITITTSLGYTEYLPVTLNVTSGATLLPFATNLGQSVVCIAANGTCSPPTQTLSLTSSDAQTGSPTTLTVNSITPSAAWIAVSNTCTGSTPISTCTITINPASLTNGLNNGSIAVNWVNGSSSTSTLTIPVAVLVSGSSATSGPLTFNPTTLSFTGTNPAAQMVDVISQSSSSFTAAVTGGATWLLVSPGSGTATTSGYPVTVSVNTSGLAAGPYTGVISFTPAGGTAETYTVNLTVPSASGSVTASPTSLSFTAQAGGQTTGAQTVTVTSPSGATGVGFTYSTTQTWILVSTTPGGTGSTTGQGAAPTNLYISVNPANLPVGVSTGVVNIGGASVSVSVTVSAAATVSASATSLNFSYTAGNSAPSPTSGTVTVSGTPGATFTAAATSNGNWLTLSSTSGTIPSGGSTPITVSLQNLTALTVASAPYTGTIVVAGSGGAVGSTTLNASLTVSAPLPTVLSVNNAASFNTGPLSAGEVFTIFGTELGPATGVALSSSNITNGALPTTLGGVSVTVGGYSAPMLYASASQVSAIVPYQIDSPVFLVSVPVIVSYLGQTSNGYPETQVATAPGIFTLNSSGSGPGAILNSDLSLNCNCSTGRPANKGEIVVLYVTGEGQTQPAGKTGSINPSTAPFPQPVIAPLVTISGLPAQVVFYGEAPTEVAGVLQINVVVPSGAVSGQANPVVVSFGSSYSQMAPAGIGAVTVAVK